MEQEELSNKKETNYQERVSKWLNDKNNLIFLAIITFGIIVRLYYFFLTKSQALWWDEADYMAYAKNLSGVENFWNLSPQHESLFPYIVSFFFRLGISEPVIKLCLEIIPSILLLFLTYKICLMAYNNQKIALISTFLLATFWEILFNSMRFHLENIALFFAFLSIYIFFKSYENREKFFKLDPKWSLPVVGFLVVLTYVLRRGFFIFGFFFLFYLLFTKNIKFLIKDKYNWIAILVVLSLLVLSELFLFSSPIGEIAETYNTQGATLNLIPFQVFNSYFQDINQNIDILLYLFYFGAIIVLINLFLSMGYFTKTENKNLKADLFWMLTIIITLSYFIFYQKRITDIGDPRWYYPLLLGSFICISRAAVSISDYIKNYNKLFSILFLIAIIGYGGFYEMQHADMIIKNKIPSFQGIREASIYLKEISSPEDIIISVPTSQPAYYAERQVVYPAYFLNKTSNSDTTLEEFIQVVEGNLSVKYIIVTFSEPNHPSWMRQEEYSQDPNTGQTVYSKWIIPFAQTTIDFTTGQQDIKQEVSYGKITFKLIKVYEDTFVYEIIRI